jgi:hypothetical protein
LDDRDYYTGGHFNVFSDQTEQLVSVPGDQKLESGKVSYFAVLRNFLRWSLKHKFLVTFVFLVITAIFTAIDPSVINIILTSLYALYLGWQMVGTSRKPLISGVVEGPDGKPLPRATLKIINTATNQLEAIAQTDKDGRFRAYVDRGKYQIIIVKPGYLWDEGSALSFEEFDTSSSKNLVFSLRERPIYHANRLGLEIFGV